MKTAGKIELSLLHYKAKILPLKVAVTVNEIYWPLNNVFSLFDMTYMYLPFLDLKASGSNKFELLNTDKNQ